MNKSLGIVISCSIVCALLAGCSIPGITGQSDDADEFIPNGSYYTNSSGTEQVKNYKWVIEPSVSSDNIIVFDSSQIDPERESNTSYINISVVCRNGMYGFIDYDGDIVVKPSYSYYYTCPCGETVLYNISDEQNNVYEYCSIDSEGQVHDYVQRHQDYSSSYFWSEPEKAVYELKKNENYATRYNEKKTVVVANADVTDVGGGNFEISGVDDSAYALAKENELVLDFEYTDYYAPAFKGAGLTAIALEKDGKWGYVSSSGEVIVPFECDSVLSSYNGTLIDSDENSHPYLFTEEFVPVSVNSSYGYYNIYGECVVEPGEFEQARPVHNGRAWVRKNGLWGVIQLGEIVEEESRAETSFVTTTTTYSWQPQPETEASQEPATTTTTTIETEAPQTQTSETVSQEISTEATSAVTEISESQTSSVQTQAPTETQPPETEPAAE